MSHRDCDFFDLRAKIDELSTFLTKYSKLSDCHLVDFITQDLYHNLLPQNLQDSLSSLTDEELSKLPSCDYLIEKYSAGNSNFTYGSKEDEFGGKSTIQNSMSSSSSLVEFLIECRRFRTDVMLTDGNRLNRFLARDSSEISRMTKKLKLRYCTDEKKSHEIEEMAAAVATMAEDTRTNLVIDIGSGRGYLGSLLAMYYGLRVYGLDSSDSNTHSASQRLDRVQKDWKTTLSKAGISVDQQSTLPSVHDSKGHYTPITCAIDSSTNLDRILSIDGTSDEETDQSPGIDRSKDFVVCGLHTCGDLASQTLRMFVECDRAKALLSVGCCYHLMDERYSEENSCKKGSAAYYGFPMSRYFQSKRYALGRKARLLAQQPVFKMADQISLPDRSLHWRAMLEKMIWDLRGEQTNILEKQVGRVAKRCKDFQDYVPKALRNLGLDLQMTPDLIAQYESTYADYKRKLTIFFQLRCALAQPIESFVLMDRLCYLLEQDTVESAKIVPLFDPIVSPRFYAIWARKR